MQFSNRALLKYLFIILIIIAAVKFSQKFTNEKKIIIGLVIIAIILFLLCDTKVMIKTEPMTSEDIIIPEEELDCDLSQIMPTPYKLNYNKEDLAKTGLNYDNNDPRNPLFKKGQFSKYMMDIDQVRDVINKQIYNYPDYHINSPGYFLLNNGKYSNDGIPYEKADSIIKASKFRDLYNQHNHNIKWSPHTHFGKARGYMNLDQIYP